MEEQNNLFIFLRLNFKRKRNILPRDEERLDSLVWHAEDSGQLLTISCDAIADNPGDEMPRKPLETCLRPPYTRPLPSSPFLHAPTIHIKLPALSIC